LWPGPGPRGSPDAGSPADPNLFEALVRPSAHQRGRDSADERGRIVEAECLTRDGWRLADCNVVVFKALKQRRLIMSRGGGPYLITREGLERLRPQLDNRTSGRKW
jgi:hypothetical protein